METIRKRFDEETFNLTEECAARILKHIPEVRSIAFIVDFDPDCNEAPCASWHARDGKVSPSIAAGMLRRIPSLYQQLLSVMARISNVLKERIDANSGTGNGSDCASEHGRKCSDVAGSGVDAGSGSESMPIGS